MTTARPGAATWPVAVMLLAILLTSLHFVLTNFWRLSTLTKLIAFEAAEPFQHRILLPAMAAGLQRILPLGEHLLFALLEVVAWVALLVVAHRALVLFRIGSSELTRRLLAASFTIPLALHLIVPNLQFKPVYVVQGGTFELGTWHAEELFYYPYDLPAAVFTLGLALLLVRFARGLDWRWLAAYIGLFAVATFNRETTLLMIPAFALVFHRRLPPAPLAAALMLQVVIFAVIQGSLQWAFAGAANHGSVVPGTAYENHLVRNFLELSNPLYLATFLARFTAGAYLIVLVLRAHLDGDLGRILLGFGIPLLAVALLMGRIQEQRIVIELVPLFWLAALQVLAARPVAAADPPPGRGAPAPQPVARAAQPDGRGGGARGAVAARPEHEDGH